MVKINEIGIIQNANLNSATSTNTQKTPNNSIFANNPTDNKPKVISEGEVKVKGDDGKKYKAYEVVTQEVDDKGQTGNSKRSKMKQCKMPPGFSAKYLSTSISVTKIQFENE